MLANFLISLLLVVSILVISIGQYYDKKSQDLMNTENCESLVITMDQAYNDTLLSKDRQAGLLGCYCL